jgi:type IV pilus assembly protein PilM
MSGKGLAEKIKDLFRPETPVWACEFTSRHVIVTGIDGTRTKLQGKDSIDIPEGALGVSLNESNIRKPEVVQTAVQEILRSAGFKGSEIALVIPDDTARISFVTAETLPGNEEERQTFIRWKLKKTVPFDVDTAQIAYRILGRHDGSGNESVSAKGSVDLLVAMCPRSIVGEYEALMDGMDVHAGLIIPSTLAALNLFEVPKEDVLFVKAAPDCVTTTVFQDRRIKFYRRVSGLDLYDSIYPTVLYYQDKLGGQTFSQMRFCGYERDIRADLAGIQDALGIPIVPLEPKNIEDLYKPALGATHFSWANLI